MAKTKCTNPDCGETFNVDDALIGKTKTCPKCKKPFKLEKVEETTPVRKPVAPAPKPRPSDDDSRTVSMPVDEPKLLYTCTNCSEGIILKKRLAGMSKKPKVKCAGCERDDIEVDTTTGYTECPHCLWVQAATSDVGESMKCANTKCKKPFVVPKPKKPAAVESSPFTGLDEKPTAPKAKDDKDDGNPWSWNPKKWGKVQWVLAILALLLLLSYVGSWFGGSKGDPAANQKAVEAAKLKAKAESEARAKEIQRKADEAEKARQALIQKQLDDAEAARKAAADLLKKKQDEEEAKKKAKDEKFQPAETWVKGDFKATYQKGSKGFPDGRFGTWSITESTRKGDMVEFKGTFDHSKINADNKGPVTGTLNAKTGELKASLIVSDVKGKLLEFKVEMKVTIREDGKIDMETEATGNLKYVWIRDLKDGPAVPEGRQTPHSYQLTRVDKK